MKPQTLRVLESNEQTIIDQLVLRLTRYFPAIPPEKVAAVVKEIYTGFEGRPLREFVPSSSNDGRAGNSPGLAARDS